MDDVNEFGRGVTRTPSAPASDAPRFEAVRRRYVSVDGEIVPLGARGKAPNAIETIEVDAREWDALLAAKAAHEQLSLQVLQCIDAQWLGTRAIDGAHLGNILAEYVGELLAANTERDDSNAAFELRDKKVIQFGEQLDTIMRAMQRVPTYDNSKYPHEQIDALVSNYLMLLQRSTTQPPAAATAAMVEREITDTARVDWLDKHCTQLDYDEDDRTVDVIHGGRNDRQWTEVGRGYTLREAIDAALRAGEGV